MKSELPEDVVKLADEALSDGPQFMLPDYGVDREALTLAIARAIMADRASRICSCLLDKPEAVEAEPIAWLCSGEGEGWKQDNRITFDREEAEKLIGVEGWTVERLGVIKERVASPAAPSTVPDGWKLVPMEPTQAMLDEACKTAPHVIMTYTKPEERGGNVPLIPIATWRAMLAASPSPVDSRELIERLVKALEPFAEIAPLVEFTPARDGERVHEQRRPDGSYQVLTRDHFREARTALAAYRSEEGGRA